MKMNISRSTIVFSVILLAWAALFIYLSRDIIFHTYRMVKTDVPRESTMGRDSVKARPEKLPRQRIQIGR